MARIVLPHPQCDSEWNGPWSHASLSSLFQIFSALIVVFAGLLFDWSESVWMTVILLVLSLSPLIECLFRASLDSMVPSVVLPPIYCFYGLGPLVSFYSDPHVINYYLMMQLLGLVSLRIGAQLGERAWNRSMPPRLPNWENDLRWLKKTLIIFAVVSVASVER